MDGEDITKIKDEYRKMSKEDRKKASTELDAFELLVAMKNKELEEKFGMDMENKDFKDKLNKLREFLNLESDEDK